MYKVLPFTNNGSLNNFFLILRYFFSFLSLVAYIGTFIFLSLENMVMNKVGIRGHLTANFRESFQ